MLEIEEKIKIIETTWELILPEELTPSKGKKSIFNFIAVSNEYEKFNYNGELNDMSIADQSCGPGQTSPSDQIDFADWTGPARELIKPTK